MIMTIKNLGRFTALVRKDNINLKYHSLAITIPKKLAEFYSIEPHSLVEVEIKRKLVKE